MISRERERERESIELLTAHIVIKNSYSVFQISLSIHFLSNTYILLELLYIYNVYDFRQKVKIIYFFKWYLEYRETLF